MKHKTRKDTSAQNRRYIKPELTRFGLVKDFTTGGSGQSSEAADEGCRDRTEQKTNPSCT